MLVDTHQHLLDRERLPYAWCDAVPALSRERLLPHYQQATALGGVPVTATLFVEGNVDPEAAAQETEWALGLSEREDTAIRGVVAAAFPERDDFAAQLAPFVQRRGLKGIRRVLHSAPPGLMESACFSRNVARLAEHNLSFDLCVRSDQLREARALARACPDVTFILDHCGSPPLGTPAMKSWSTGFARLAALPNVACKVSGLVGLVPAERRGDITPYSVVLILAAENFGWERLLWGSDWPLSDLATSLGDWWQITERLVQSITPEHRAAFFHGNAHRLYRLS